MPQIRTLCVLGFTALTSALACGGRTEPQRIGGETNWFQWCGQDADCQEGVCACGLCTERCSAEAPSCTGGPPASRCVLPNKGGFPGLCQEPAEAGLCLVSCSSDPDCGQGLSCVGGLCLAQSSPSTGPTGSVSGSTSLCSDDPTLAQVDSLVISSQADLERLRGCSSIESLLIEHDKVTDLSPLSELRVVRSGLTIQSPAAGRTLAPFSLDGLGALERVNQLQLSGFRDKDLAALHNLRAVKDLSLENFPNLTTLDALTNLDVETSLELAVLPALQSLAGPTVHDGVRIGLGGLDSLRDLRALRMLRSAASLQVSSVGLENLDDLVGLERLTSGSFTYNPALRNVNGLSGLRSVEDLTFVSNSELEKLDGLSGLETVGILQVEDNAKLTHLAEFSALTNATFAVIGNPRLQTGPSCPLLERGDLVFTSNPLLEGLGFSALGVADLIDISDNASLTQIELPSLRYVQALGIRDNPRLVRLDVSGLRGLSQMGLFDNPSLLGPGIAAHPDVAALFGLPPTEPSAP